MNDKHFHLVDDNTRKRFFSAWTSKGIHAEIETKGYTILERLSNENFGFDILVKVDHE
jgi:hypothetical protein